MSASLAKCCAASGPNHELRGATAGPGSAAALRLCWAMPPSRHRRRAAASPPSAARPAGAEPVPAAHAASIRPRWRNSPSRSGSAASCNRCWSVRTRQPPAAIRSSPASAAGGRPVRPVCTRCRRWSSEMADTEAAAVALVENLQRQDLNAMDEAEGYDRLHDPVRLDAGGLGPGRRQVAQPRRQYAAPAEPAASGEGGAAQGRASPPAMPAPCWRIPQPETALRDVIDRQMSVRQTEALATREPVRRSARSRRALQVAALTPWRWSAI